MKLLVFAHKPPPHHGQSYMVQLLVDALGGDVRDAGPKTEAAGPGDPVRIECYHVDARVSDDLMDIGHVRVQKILRLFKYCGQAIWCRLRYGVTNFYFVPAPGVKSAIWRDWMVMILCRPFYRHMVFHWHAVGIGEWLHTAKPWERWLSQRVLLQPDLSIVLGEFNREDIAWLGSRRVEVVPNGIPDPCPDFDLKVLPARLARASARQALLQSKAGNNQAGAVKVVFLGLCTREKGLFDAVQAIMLANRQLRATACRFKLMVAGAFRSEAERQEFEEMIRRPDLSEGGPWVEYVGFVSGAAKDQFLKDADCLCFPTYYGAESFGLVLVEAMAYGLSIVTTRWRSIPELLPPGYSGFVAPQAPDQIAAALVALVRTDYTPALRQRFLARYTAVRFSENMKVALQSIGTSLRVPVEARPAISAGETTLPPRPEPAELGTSSRPLKILQVYNDYLNPGGEKTSVARIAEDLEGGGHRVTRFWKQSTEWRGKGSPALWKQPFLLWRNPAVLEELRQVHEAMQPDLWLLHNVLPVVSLGVYRLARQLGVPIIQWLHNYRPVSPSGTLFAGRAPLQPEDRWIAWKEICAGSWNGRLATAWLALGYARLKRRGDFESVRAWVAISEETKSCFARTGWFPSRLHVVRHSWHVQPQPSAPRDDGYFLFLGRMVESKGVRFLAELWADPAFRNTQLVMAGQGPLAEELRDRTSPNVKWLGHIDGKAKRDLIAGCRAMLLPGLWAEPLGIVAYEAFEMGKPVLASNLGGLKEVVQDRRSGRLLEPGQPDVWRNAIANLTASQARELGLAGRRWLEDNATPQVWNQQFMNIARQVLATSHSQKL